MSRHPPRLWYGTPRWAVISTCNLDLLQLEGCGACFETALTHKILEFVGYAYVDNTDQVEMLKVSGESIKDVIDQMQQAVDLWEASIKTTSGAICPEKCHWFVVDFIWNGSEWTYASPEGIPRILMVKNTFGDCKTICCLSLQESEVTLGIHGKPFRSLDHQCARMLDQAKNWASKIEAGHLKQLLVHLAFNMTLWKTLGYLLPATMLIYAQCNTIMWPAIAAALPRMGVNHNFPQGWYLAPTTTKDWE